MEAIPAVLIGGPPHSGKSVLLNSLTMALRERRIEHYLLRAAPDYEGDFSYASNPALVQLIRRKGEFSETFVARVAAYLQKRHLPLLVDAGGLPTDEQAAAFAHCTAAVLLIRATPDAPQQYAADRARWLGIAERAGLPLLADLRSELGGADALQTAGPPIRGTLAGLERGRMAGGPAFAALAERLAAEFRAPDVVAAAGGGGSPSWAARHAAMAPAGARVVDLQQMARELDPGGGQWRPGQLAALRIDVGPGRAPAFYGRAPVWAYAAGFAAAWPRLLREPGDYPAWVFDAKEGWLAVPALPPAGRAGAAAPQEGWTPRAYPRREWAFVDLATPQLIDPHEPAGLPLPDAGGGAGGLVLGGKAANWMVLAAARGLAPGRAWLAVYQPQLAAAVVVAARSGRGLGDVIPMGPRGEDE